jgi:hypothetical protein
LTLLGVLLVSAGLCMVLLRGVLSGGSMPAATQSQADAEPTAPIVLVTADTAAGPPPAPLDEPDFELLLSPDQLALTEELEFYAWLQSGSPDAH